MWRRCEKLLLLACMAYRVHVAVRAAVNVKDSRAMLRMAIHLIVVE